MTAPRLRLAPLVATTCLVMVIGGCGDDDRSPSALLPTSTTAAPPAAAPAPTLAPRPLLVVSSAGPAEGPGNGGTPVVIVGEGFWSGVRVRFGGIEAVVTEVAENRLEVITPPSVAPLPDVVDIVVADPFLGEQVILPGAFRYTVDPTATTDPTDTGGDEGFLLDELFGDDDGDADDTGITGDDTDDFFSDEEITVFP